MRCSPIALRRAHSRGGWIVLEYLRECVCLVLLLGAAMVTLQRLTPTESPSAAALAVAANRSPIYSLGFSDNGQALWLNRLREGLVMLELDNGCESDRLQLRDTSLIDADMSAGSPTSAAVVTDRGAANWFLAAEGGTTLDLKPEEGLIADIKVQGDGQVVVAVTNSGTIATWTRTDDGPALRLDRAAGALTLLELSPDGEWSAIIADNCELLIHHRATGRIVRRWRTDHVHCSALAWSPDGRQLATGGKGGLVQVWERSTGRKVWDAKGDILAPSAVRFSQDGQRLACGGFDRVVRLFDAASGRLEATLAAHSGPVRALAFHPDGQRLLSGGLDGQVFEWSLETQRVLRSFH
jgi:WD40 repeat protein